MKILNNLFAVVYGLVFVGSGLFAVNFLIKRGSGGMFDNITEIVLAVLYVVALVLSIFMHLQLKKLSLTVSHKICLSLTFVNALLLLYVAITVAFASSDSGLTYVAIMFVMCVLWLGSIVMGLITLRPRPVSTNM